MLELQEQAGVEEQERPGDGMRAADVKRLTPPPQITESDDPGIEYWLAGFETMRNAVLFLLDRDIQPTWEFKPVDMANRKSPD